MTGRIVFLVCSLALSSIAAAPGCAQDAPGCGSANVKFDVKTGHEKPAAPAPASTKAVVFFLQDDVKFESRPRPTTRFGIDGNWVGATQANSYFFVSVDPGEHHLCASWQNRVSVGIPLRPTAALHFNAEAGKTYYFRAKDIGRGSPSPSPIAEVILEKMDSDEAQVLMGSFEYSTSAPKK